MSGAPQGTSHSPPSVRSYPAEKVSPTPRSTTAATSFERLAASIPSAMPRTTPSVSVFFFSGRLSAMIAIPSVSS